MSALVSIIIPIYNAAPQLARCIESVRRQTYQNLEIILVNDGSHDASLPICRMYADVDKRIVIIDKLNSGVSATRNIAIDDARGAYLQFVDADDYLMPNATEIMVTRAMEASADMVIANYYRVDGDEITEHGFLHRRDVMNRREFAKELMEEPASFYYGVLWNKLYSARIIRENCIRCSEELKWSEDFLFNLEFIRYAEHFCAVSQPVYYYVKTEGSICATSINWHNVMSTKRNLFSYYKSLYISLGLYEQYRLKIYGYLISGAEHS
ncbi:MAG: glycosyltransferase family 2 protein [Oscillospiraceae bacterium]